ncbi:hypothetical protein DMJ13_18700 [halophilic archaeon]|nr:hypothetical protein DMJ13_18700 [halophilic archaeon]
MIASVEDWVAWLTEPDDIEPSLWGVEEIRQVGVTTEVHRDIAISIPLCSHVVDRVHVVLVILEELITIVNRLRVKATSY